MVRRDAALQKQKLLEFLRMLDIWDLASFRSMQRKQQAWNAATRLLPCLTWMVKYNPRKQLAKDIAAGIAVSFLIVPQARSSALVGAVWTLADGSAARRGCPTLAWRACLLSTAYVRARCAACVSVLHLTRPLALPDADFVPLFLYFAYGSSMYLQIGAVAIVSLLTRGTIDDVLSEDKAAVALLKTAAATAAKTYTKSPTNSTLLAASKAAAATFSLADMALTQKKVDVAALLAFFAGVFSFGIGILKVGKVMNLMGPAVISGFQTAAAITIALGQFKNIFGYSSDFTQSSHLDDIIQSFIDLRPTLNTRATWSGWMWIAILFSFRQLGGTAVRGRKPFNFLKITGPVALCIIAIVSTKLTGLHLSPGCTVFNEQTGISNVYFANASTAQWNISGAPPDNPGCVPMPKSVVGSILPLPWPGDRGLSIVGKFGKPPTGNVHLRWEYINGKLLTGAIIITLVASLESIAIAKALASKHRQPDLDPNKEYIALGLANIFGSFTSSYPISGSFSRSALNDDLGASSPVAMLTVATIVGITLKIASTVPMFCACPCLNRGAPARADLHVICLRRLFAAERAVCHCGHRAAQPL